MSDRTKGISRRQFVAAGSGVAASGLLGIQTGKSVEAAGEPPRSRVVMIRRKDAVDGDGVPNSGILPGMLDEALVKLFEVDDPGAAWRRVVKATDVVGVKTNVWNNLRTPPALETAIRDRVVEVGVQPTDVAVDDRGILGNPVFERASAIINIRPLRTHHWSGLGTCLKNLIMYVPRPHEYHGDSCATLGAIWQLPAIEGKVRLNILVMLTPQFHGIGPHSFSKRFVWPYGGLIVSTDPVAADATGARVIEAKRREFFGEDRPISPPPHHIQIAETRYGLGVADPKRIDLIRLGWDQDPLI